MRLTSKNILLVSMRISCIYINPNLITIVRVIVFNITFNNISVLSCRSVFLIRAVMITLVTKTCSPIVILQRTKESLYSSHTIAMSSKADHARCTRHNIMCNQSLSPLKLWVGIPFMYLIQHYVKKFASDLRQAGGFSRVLRFPPPIKLTATI